MADDAVVLNFRWNEPRRKCRGFVLRDGVGMVRYRGQQSTYDEVTW